MLAKHAKKRHISFHTPGHKNPTWDITELIYSDNLSAPNGVLKEAQEDVGALLGAYKSFLLTDGSTSGVLSMLHAAKTLGAKSILAREDSHKSLYNGCALLGLKLLLLPMAQKNGIPLPLQVEDVSKELFAQADALFITSPDYYGNIPPLACLNKLCKEQGKLLLIDGAHGGHLHFDKTLYAGAFADLWVDGVHKSLPALTQGAIVSAREQKQAEALQTAVDIFRTTSPSYPMMASIEYAVKYPQNTALKAQVELFQKEQPRVYKNSDWTKLCCLFGNHAFSVEKELLSRGIYPEFCDGNIVCFYLSSATKPREWKTLKKVIIALFEKYPFEQQIEIQRNPAPVVLTKTATEWVRLEESENRVLAANIGLFPPCTPLKKAGEGMDRESIEKLQKADNVFGVINGNVAVYKEE